MLDGCDWRFMLDSCAVERGATKNPADGGQSGQTAASGRSTRLTRPYGRLLAALALLFDDVLHMRRSVAANASTVNRVPVGTLCIPGVPIGSVGQALTDAA